MPMKELFQQRSSKKELMQYIFRSYYSYVYYAAYTVVKDFHTAEDITQETFIKAYHHIDSIHDTKKLRPWLKTIATRSAIDYLRKTKHQMKVLTYIEDIDNICTVIDKSSRSQTEEIMERKIDYQFIVEKMDCLKSEYRDILLLKYRYDLKNMEIADKLGITTSAAKTRLFRARNQLRIQLRKSPTFLNGL